MEEKIREGYTKLGQSHSVINSSFLNCGYSDGPPVAISCGYMQPSNNPSSWLPGGKVKIESVIHELGHAFDSRSPEGNQTILSNAIDANGFFLTDCEGRMLLGNSVEWIRGDLGWGSVAKDPENPLGGQFDDGGQDISPFQQHPYLNDGTQPDEETVADMFLNWVYRRTTGGDFTGDPCLAPASESWQGFLNIDQNEGALPEGKPGNVRYGWFDDQVHDIFQSRPTWR